MKWTALAFAGAIPVVAEPAPAGGCADHGGIVEQTARVRNAVEAKDTQPDALWRRVMRGHPSGGDRAAHQAEIRAARRAGLAFRDVDRAARARIGVPGCWDVNRLSRRAGDTRIRARMLKEVYLD